MNQYIPFDFSYICLNKVIEELEEIPSFSGTMFVSYSINQDLFISNEFRYDNGKWKYEELNDDFFDPQVIATYSLEQDALSSWVLKRDNDTLFKLSGTSKTYLPFNYKDTTGFTYPAYDESLAQNAYWLYTGDSSNTFDDICIKPFQMVFGTEAIVKISFENSTLSSGFDGTYTKTFDEDISNRNIFIKKNSKGDREYILYYDNIGRYILMKYEDYESIKMDPSYISQLLIGNDPGTYEMFILSLSSDDICYLNSSRNTCKSYPFNNNEEPHWIAFGNGSNGTVTNVYVNYRLSDVNIKKLSPIQDVVNNIDYNLIDDLL